MAAEWPWCRSAECRLLAGCRTDALAVEMAGREDVWVDLPCATWKNDNEKMMLRVRTKLPTLDLHVVHGASSSWHGRGHGLHRMVIRSSRNRCV